MSLIRGSGYKSQSRLKLTQKEVEICPHRAKKLEKTIGTQIILILLIR